MSFFALNWIVWVFFYSVARDPFVEHIDVILVIYGIYMNQRFLFVGWRQQSCDCTLVDFNRFGKRCSAAELSKTLPVVVQFTIMSRVFKAVYLCDSIVQTVMFLLAKNHNFITSGVILIHSIVESVENCVVKCTFVQQTQSFTGFFNDLLRIEQM